MLEIEETPGGALDYPYPQGPKVGSPMPVCEGVYWLRMPLPFLLGHINLWLLRDGPGWVVVDCGIADEASRTAWQQVFDTGLQGMPLSGVMVTHLHPDHVGLAGWLCEHWQVELWMSRTEYLLCRSLVADTGRPAPLAGQQFYRRAGFDEAALQRYREKFGAFGSVVAPLPDSFTRLVDGKELRIGGNTWKVLVGRGHSPEHACLYCAELNVLISGDQVLPTISSNVSVWPTEPHADPLSDWLESCAALREILPADVLVLPSHGRPFRGVRERLSALIRYHEDCLEKVRELCRVPHNAVELFPALFKSRITAGNMIMAAGESVAHINCLLGRGELVLAESRNGVDYFRRA